MFNTSMIAWSLSPAGIVNRFLLMIKNILISLIIALTSASVCAQNQNEHITISYSDKPLGEILIEITGKYGVNFLYSNELSVLKRRVSINANDVSIDALLKELFDKAGADFKIIDGHVAISERMNSQTLKGSEQQMNQRTEKTQQSNLKSKPIADQLDGEKRSASMETIRKPESDVPSVIINESKENLLQEDKSETKNTEASDPDKKSNTSSESVSRKILNGNSFIGLILRGDSYHFTQPIFEGSKSSFTQDANYSIGISLNHILTDKWSVEIQALLSRRNFRLNYNFSVVDLDDPFVIDNTSFDLLYIGVPVNVRREVLTKDQFSLSLIGGLSPEFLVRQDVQTFLKNGLETSTPDSFGSVRPFTFAAQVGLNAEYQINGKFNLVVSPSYRKYLTKFNDGETGINVHALSLNIGFYYKL